MDVEEESWIPERPSLGSKGPVETELLAPSEGAASEPRLPRARRRTCAL